MLAYTAGVAVDSSGVSMLSTKELVAWFFIFEPPFQCDNGVRRGVFLKLYTVIGQVTDDCILFTVLVSVTIKNSNKQFCPVGQHAI